MILKVWKSAGWRRIMHAIINRSAWAAFYAKNNLRQMWTRLHRFNKIEVLLSFIWEFNLRSSCMCHRGSYCCCNYLIRARVNVKAMVSRGWWNRWWTYQSIDFSLRQLYIKSLINQTRQCAHHRKSGNFRDNFNKRMDFFSVKHRYDMNDNLKARPHGILYTTKLSD